MNLRFRMIQMFCDVWDPLGSCSFAEQEAFLQLCCGRWASLWTALLEATKALEAWELDIF